MTEFAPASLEPTPNTQTSVELSPPQSDPKSTNFAPEANEPEKKEKPLTARQALEKASSELKAEPQKAPELKPDAKTAPKETQDNKPAVEGKEENPDAQTAGVERNEQEPEKPRPSEGKGHEAPPARFLPRAKEEWATVPENVKYEVHRTIAEMERGLEESKDAREFRKQIQPYEEMAKQAGVPFQQAIKNYIDLDSLVSSNPVAGVERILANQGIDLVSFAQHVLGQAQQAHENPQQYQMTQTIQQLQQEIAYLKQVEEAKSHQESLQEIENTLFSEARERFPRFDELRPHIAKFFTSDILPNNLDVKQRLFAAIDYAERTNPAFEENAQRLRPAVESRPLNPAGEKSIKGSPNPGTDPGANKNRKLNREEAIRAAMAEAGFHE